MTHHAYRLKEQIFGAKMTTFENKFLISKWLLLKISNFTCTVVKKTLKKCSLQSLQFHFKCRRFRNVDILYSKLPMSFHVCSLSLSTKMAAPEQFLEILK